MPDMLAFLAGLRYDGDHGIVSATGEIVAVVVGACHAGLSPDQVASLLISACHQAARTCETCKHWVRNAMMWNDYGKDKRACRRWGRPRWLDTSAADGCSFWEPREERGGADDKWRPPPCFPGEAHDWERLAQREWPAIACCRICGLTLVEGEEDGMQEDEEAADA